MPFFNHAESVSELLKYCLLEFRNALSESSNVEKSLKCRKPEIELFLSTDKYTEPEEVRSNKLTVPAWIAPYKLPHELLFLLALLCPHISV